MPEQSATDLFSLLDERLARLSCQDRELVFLRFYEGRTLPEIAERTGQSLAAIQKRSSRLLDRLRRELASRGHALSVIILAQLLDEQLRAAAAPHSIVTSVTTKSAMIPPSIGNGPLVPLLGSFLCGVLTTGLLLENHQLREAIKERPEGSVRVQGASNPPLHLERTSSLESEVGLLTFRTALNRFAVQPASFERRLHLERAIERLRPADLPEAAELALNSRTTRSKGFISGLFARWAGEDLEAALAKALTPEARRTLIVENGGMENDALDGVVDTIARMDPTKGLALIEELNLSSWNKSGLRHTLFKVVARESPEMAWRLANTLTHISTIELEMAITTPWAKKDPEAALLAVVDSCPKTGDQNELVRQLMNTLCAQDLNHAQELAEAIPSLTLRETALSQVISHLAREDLQAAFQLAEGSTKRIGALGRQVYDQGGAGLICELAREMETGPDRDQFLVNAADRTRWHSGSDDVFKIIDLIDRPSARAALLHQSADLLAQPSFDHILDEWFSELPSPVDRDAFVACYSAKLGRDRPEEAMRWLERIEERAVKSIALRTVIREHENRHPDKVRSFIATHPDIPQHEKKYWGVN